MVAKQAILEGLAMIGPEEDIENLVNSNIWKPEYNPIN